MMPSGNTPMDLLRDYLTRKSAPSPRSYSMRLSETAGSSSALKRTGRPSLKMGVSIMQLSKFTPWALLTVVSFAPAPAVADPAYACSVAEIFECTAIAGCQRVSAQQAGLPPFVTLNVKEKRLFSGLFGGEGLFEPGDVYEDPQVLILHGRHGLLTWSAVVAKDTGQMSMSIANIGKTYAQFGSCTPQQ